MWWLCIIAPVILCAAILAMQLYAMRRPDRFGGNSGYYLAGDGSWAGQMAPATIDKDGNTGLVPAPLLGQQNSYLRGDGKWIRASNAPTIAQYLFATSIADQTVGALPYAILFPDILASNGVTAASSSTFTLSPASTYKLSACITFCSINMVYRWFNVTAGIYILGECANNNATSQGTPNMAFITTTGQTTVALHATFGPGSIIYGQGYDIYSRGPWMTIEMLSNNNTITAFTGATALAAGSIGYIPKPLAGQQNYLLTGGGKWQPPAINSYTRSAAAGKQNIVFANIPPYTNRITIMLTNVVMDSDAVPVAQLGAGNIQTADYYSVSSYIGPSSGNGMFSNGWYVTPGSRGKDVRHGNYYITHSGGNLWTCTGSFVANENYISFCGGSVQLSGVLDQVRVSTSDGKSVFTNGIVNVLYE